MSTTCVKCKSKCLLYSLSCLYQDTTLLNAALDSERVKAFMDLAQLIYLKPLLGDCFDELCTALEASRLPDTDPDYAELPEKWSNLLSEAQELVNVATEYLYISRLGWGSLKKSGFDFIEDLDIDGFKMVLTERKFEVLAMQSYVKEWLAERDDTYTCLPYETTSCKDEDISELDIPFHHFFVTD